MENLTEMVLRGGDSDDVVMKKNKKEKNCRPISGSSQTDQSIRSQTKKMDHICIPRKKVGSVSSSIEEDFDFDKQLGKATFSSSDEGDEESMWLSSGSISPSSFFDQHEKFWSPFDFVADEWLVSWMSRFMADSYISLSKSKPDEEHKSFALVKAVSGNILQKTLEGDGGIAWRLQSPRNYATDLPTNSSERIKSENIDFESSLQVSETMDKTSFTVPSLNPDEDGSNWMSDTNLELVCFDSCFPCPSCSSTTINRTDEITESNLPLEQSSEAESLEDFSADEPLFWPFDKKIDWNSEETWKYFSMSPRKGIIKVTIPEETSPRSIGSELSTKRNTNPSNRLVLNSGSTASKILEFKQGSKGYYNNKNNNNGRVKKGNTIHMSSRLRESTKDSTKIVPLDNYNQILPLKLGEVATTKSVLASENFWEDDFTLNEELPIETVLGLGEFDGHEGIDSEFSEGIFSLDEAL